MSKKGNHIKYWVDCNGIEYFKAHDNNVYKLPSHNSRINLKYPSHRALRESVFHRDNYQCQMCGATGILDLDHIYPFSKGGKHYPDNLQALCMVCNCFIKRDKIYA